jgi:hypothetical protein
MSFPDFYKFTLLKATKTTASCNTNMNNESIKSPEEIIKDRKKLASPYSLIDNDIKECMQYYSDQNLTEYKRRLKEGVDEIWEADGEISFNGVLRLIDSIYLNKK